MPTHHYEHHIDIRKDKLCPFKLHLVKNHNIGVCNWHENIEIIFITEGSGTVRYGSEEFGFAEGDIIIINSGALHKLYSGANFSYYYLIVDEGFCLDNGISTKNRAFTPLFRCEETSRLYNQIIHSFARYSQDNKTPLKVPKFRLAVLALLIEIYENHSEPKNCRGSAEKHSGEYVKRIMTYIEDRFSENLTLESLADICGISKHHLAREFKRYTGQTVLTYLNTIRCRNAEVFLSEGMSVTDTAFECGFESISYFSRTYKKIIGVPPSKAAKR